MTTVAFVFTAGQAEAAAYYKTFTSEPVQPEGLLKVDRPESLGSGSDLGSLLTAITTSKCTNALIVSHGTTDGLIIFLKDSSGTEMSVDAVKVLNQVVDGKIKPADAAALLRLETADVSRLRGQITAVRKRKLDRLVLRACKVGQNAPGLDAFRELFGARSICAPDIQDTFGSFDTTPASDSKTFEKIAKRDRMIIEGKAPHRFAWRTDIRPLQITFPTTSVAESKQGAKDFAARHFPDSHYTGEGSISFHGLVPEGARRPLFPLDAGFRGHLKRRDED